MTDRTCYYCGNIGTDLELEIGDELKHVHCACVQGLIGQYREQAEVWNRVVKNITSCTTAAEVIEQMRHRGAWAARGYPVIPCSHLARLLEALPLGADGSPILPGNEYWTIEKHLGRCQTLTLENGVFVATFEAEPYAEHYLAGELYGSDQARQAALAEMA